MFDLTDVRRATHLPRHRLGTAGLVHCTDHREVALALSLRRRRWLRLLLVPARHSRLRVLGREVVARPVLVPAT